MLKIILNEKEALAILQLEGALSSKDFEHAVEVIDPFLEKNGQLNGIIIYTEHFPGWDSFTSLVRHLKFIKNHHEKVTHLAFVTDSIIGEFAIKIGSHFVAAEVKIFPYKALDNAKNWVLNKKHNHKENRDKEK